jgi:hypothetical protein
MSLTGIDQALETVLASRDSTREYLAATDWLGEPIDSTVVNLLKSEWKFRCPVCNYLGLEAKPYEIWPPPEGLVLRPPYEDQLGRPSYEVCIRCSFEFGFDDNPGTATGMSFEEYRRAWDATGRPWLREPRTPHETD